LNEILWVSRSTAHKKSHFVLVFVHITQGEFELFRAAA